MNSVLDFSLFYLQNQYDLVSVSLPYLIPEIDEKKINMTLNVLPGTVNNAI